MAELPREVSPGEAITAEWANQLVAAIRQQANLTVAAPLQMSHGAHGTHLSMQGPFDLILVELQEALSSGSSADAYRLVWDGSDWTTTGADTIEVFDSVGGSRDGASGDRGYAFFNRRSGQYELLVLGC